MQKVAKTHDFQYVMKVVFTETNNILFLKVDGKKHFIYHLIFCYKVMSASSIR
jgi:hypothetical protein